MPVRFKKKIARPGVVLPKNPLTKQRKVEVITRDRLRNVAKTGNEMLKEGILIPLPYGHSDENGVYPIPLLSGLNGNLVDAKSGGVPSWDLGINAGFVKAFEIDASDGGLVIEVEAEGEVENQETHAGRIGKTYKHTSPLICDFVDGSGKLWRDAPLHVCLTNRAVQHNQPEFELLLPNGNQNQELIAKQGLTSPELAIAMAFGDEDYADLGAASTNQLLAKSLLLGPTSSEDLMSEVTGRGMTPEMVLKISKLLKEKLDLTLPEDTDISNFGDRLLTIFTNMEPRKEGDLFTQMPNNSEVIQSPMIMSLQAANPANPTPTNPNPGSPQTPNPGTPSNPSQPNPTAPSNPNPTAPPNASNPDDLVIARSNTLLKTIVADKRQRSTERIRNLVRSGRIGRDYANKKLGPMVTALSLSLEDIVGEVIPQTPLELALDTLEQADALTQSDPKGQDEIDALIKGDGAIIPDETDDMRSQFAEPTEDEVKAHYERVLGR